MLRIDKEIFSLLKSPDRIRVYLYLSNRGVTGKTLARVSGIARKDVTGRMFVDMKRGFIKAYLAEDKEAKRQVLYYYITKKGYNYYKFKLPIIETKRPKSKKRMDKIKSHSLLA